jgi:cation diffusion facilitator CzcD-associated flavoprotein CzcO
MLSRSTDDLEVVVVGAGAAGLGAAKRLVTARVSVTVLEARGRVDGRAYTFADAPYPLDLGCGWLHLCRGRQSDWPRLPGGLPAGSLIAGHQERPNVKGIRSSNGQDSWSG